MTEEEMTPAEQAYHPIWKEFDEACKQGQNPDPEEYLERCPPEYREELYEAMLATQWLWKMRGLLNMSDLLRE